MRYRSYKNYKSSNVNYLPEFPSEWNIMNMKYLISNIQTGSTPSTKNEDYFNGNIQWFTPGDFKEQFLIEAKKNITEIAIRDNEAKLLGGGTVCIVGIGATLGKVAILKEESSFNQQITGINTNEKLNNKYLYYWLLDNKERINKIANYTTLPIINNEFLKNLKVFVPSIEEQKKIVEFLNKKSFEIDGVIEEKEKLIELLKEKREAIITEAVTKGIDKDVKMKDSGVEWIGKIPENWHIKKLRYLGDLQNGISKSAEYFGKGFPFVSYSDVYKNEEIPKAVNGKLESTTSERELYSVKEGDVFFTRTSETIQEIGFASTCFSSIKDSTFAGFLIRFRPNEKMLYKGFSKYYFRSNIHRRFFVKEMNIVTRASLSQELLKQLPILIPSINEQKKIYDFLNRKTLDIDSLITDIEIQINSLKEYKKSLISEVVTGKIDVRNEV